jgi:23S rRNA U2552 (ribose-2'-O)-methylase RlmE/FtsJ
MSLADLPLTQRITVLFDVEEPKRHVEVVILDAADDNAATVTADWAADAFTLEDLFGAVLDHAKVAVTENGETQTFTGKEFHGGLVLRELDGVDPTSVTFEDLESAE